MTLGENKKIVLSVIEDYNGESTLTADEDILEKINGCYSQAYQEVSQVKPIIKIATLDRSAIGTTKYYRDYAFPSDMRKLVSVMRHDTTTNELLEPEYYTLDDKNIVINDLSEGIYKIKYYAYPTTITPSTADSFSLEVDLNAQHLLAWKVASIILKTDPSADWEIFEAEYNKQLQMTSPTRTTGMIMLEQTSL